MQKGKNAKSSPKTKPTAKALKDEELQKASGGGVYMKYGSLNGAGKK